MGNTGSLQHMLTLVADRSTVTLNDGMQNMSVVASLFKRSERKQRLNGICRYYDYVTKRNVHGPMD